MNEARRTVTGPDLGTLEQMITDSLARAREKGASQAEASASLGTGLSVTVRKGEVETLEHQRDRGFHVTVYFGHRKGTAATSDLAAQALEETVDKAVSIARFTAEDPCTGLADADRMAGDYPDLDLDHPWDLSPEAAIDLARRAEAAGMASESAVTNTEGGSVQTGRGLRAYGNSHGFLGHYATTSHSISCVLVAGDAGAMERDYWYTAARHPDALQDAEEVGREAARRAARRLGARRVPTGQAPVLFPAELARGLLGHFVSAIRGTSQYRKASFLLGAAGRRVFPAFLRIAEAPHIPRGMASAPFDSEGVATVPRDLVADGVLQGYVLSAYSARRLGLQTTGNAGGIHNLVVTGGERDPDELLAELGTGLMVTELMGQGVNLVTGDYSRGAAGFWVEGGEIAFPVSEVTIAGNLARMLMGIRGVGTDLDLRGGIRTGSILLDKMTVAGE